MITTDTPPERMDDHRAGILLGWRVLLGLDDRRGILLEQGLSGAGALRNMALIQLELR